MLGNFQREVTHEIQRLENRIERLRGFLDEMEEDMPESPDVTASAEEQDDSPADTPREPISSSRSGLDPQQIVDMLARTPINKSGSLDLRTDAGRTLRTLGYLDKVGYPTEEAEALMKQYKKTFKRRVTSSARR